MAYSVIQICNLALSHIGARTSIETLDEPSAAAQQCKLWYPLARQEVLESYNWNFARRYKALALHDDAPPANWLFRYQYPADCLKGREIDNPLGKEADAIPYKAEAANDGVTMSILCNIENAVLIYTFDQMNTGMYSKNFINALAHYLGSRIAPTLTGKRDLVQEQMNWYSLWLRKAEADDANENVEDKPRDAEWIRARN